MRSHAQRVLDELALANFAFALDIRWTGLHTTDVRLLQLQFRGVFDRQEALFFRDKGGQRVEHRRLAGTGAAGDDRGNARLDRGRKQFRHRLTQSTDINQLGDIERLLGKFTD